MGPKLGGPIDDHPGILDAQETVFGGDAPSQTSENDLKTEVGIMSATCCLAPMGPNLRMHLHDPLGSAHANVWPHWTTISRAGPHQRQLWSLYHCCPALLQQPPGCSEGK
jgi:hypothetical protein